MRFRPALLALALVLPALAALGLAPPSRAATTYTFTGAAGSAWGNPASWSPNGTPQDGDSVSVDNKSLTGVPTVTLAQLSVSGASASVQGDGTLSVGTLQWQGGAIDVDLGVGAVGALPSVITPGQSQLRYGGATRTLTVLGDLTLAPGLGAGSSAWLQLMFDSSIDVASTGTLRLDAAAHVLGNRCCTNDTSTISVDGTLEVSGAAGHVARLEQLGLDLAGVVDVPVDHTLRLVGGPVRVGGEPSLGTVGDGSVRGGGTLDVAETDGEAFDPAHPLDPDGTVKFLATGEVLTLAEGSTLVLGDDTEVSGTGRITGDGSVRLAGANVRGDLTLDVPARTAAGTTTRLVDHDDRPGQTGVLRPRGGLTIVPASVLRVHGGTTLSVPDGARVALQGGATLSSDGCCTDPGRVSLSTGGTLAIGGGSAAPAVLEWVRVGGTGLLTHTGRTEWDPAAEAFTAGARITGTGTVEGDLATGAARVSPVGVLTVDGDWTAGSGGTYAPTLPGSRTGTTAPSRLTVTGTARLAGALAPRGDTRFATGHRVLALDAGSVSGRFRCLQAPGFLPAYSATPVRLQAIDPRLGGCVVPSSGRVLKATFQGRRTAALGVPAGTGQVLLQVSLGKAARANRLTLSGGRSSVVLNAGARKAVSRLVVVPVSAARRLTATTTQRAAVTVTRVAHV